MLELGNFPGANPLGQNRTDGRYQCSLNEYCERTCMCGICTFCKCVHNRYCLNDNILCMCVHTTHGGGHSRNSIDNYRTIYVTKVRKNNKCMRIILLCNCKC